MTPTRELMTPKVNSGVADRAAVAITVDSTAPSAKPAGARSASSSHTEPVNSDNRLNPAIASAPSKYTRCGFSREASLPSSRLPAAMPLNSVVATSPAWKLVAENDRTTASTLKCHAEGCSERQQQHRRERHRLHHRKVDTTFHEPGSSCTRRSLIDFGLPVGPHGEKSQKSSVGVETPTQ